MFPFQKDLGVPQFQAHPNIILLAGDFKHFLFSIIYEYGIILPIDQYCSRWLKHVKTTNQLVTELIPVKDTSHIFISLFSPWNTS